jgi:hypothetical protein
MVYFHRLTAMHENSKSAEEAAIIVHADKYSLNQISSNIDGPARDGRPAC